MERLLTHRPSAAMIVALVALFVALAGGAYAAVALPSRSVGARQLKKGAVTRAKLHANAVTSAKVKDHSLLAKDFEAGQLPAGAPGSKGDAGTTGKTGATGVTGATGITGYQVVVFGELVQPTDTSGLWDVSCPAGKNVLGGGMATFNKNIELQASTPLDDGTTWDVAVVPLSGATFGGSGESAVNIRIVCANVAP
jgi:hypothetical protein